MRYVVKNENTLGYLLATNPPMMGVLAGSVLKGGHNPLNGPVLADPASDNLRPATKADFEAFRVSAKGHLD